MAKTDAITEIKTNGQFEYRCIDSGTGIELVRFLDSSAAELDIPDEIDCLPVRVIGPGCFTDNGGLLTRVLVPDSVREIGKDAFSYCFVLESLELGRDVRRLGSGFLSFCGSIEHLTIPETVSDIDDAFILNALHIDTAEGGVYYSDGFGLYRRMGIGSGDDSGEDKLELVTKMIGKDMQAIFDLHPAEVAADAPDMLEAQHLGALGYPVQDISLELKKGELMGFAGLLGSGRTETASLIFAATRPTSGTLTINGKTVAAKKPFDAIMNGVAFCPEDRKRDGIIGDLSIRENIMLAVQAKRGFMHPLSRQEQNELADKYIKALSIATPDAEKKIGELSGGNQQKVIVARWMATNPDLLILDEPTRGIDVGAKAEIQRLMIEMCKDDVSVIFISSELEEVIRCSNRIVIMRDGSKAAELEGPFDGNTQSRILSIIAGEEVSA